MNLPRRDINIWNFVPVSKWPVRPRETTGRDELSAGPMTRRASPFRKGTLALVLTGAVLLAACSTDEVEYVERPVEELYNEAVDAVEVEKYGQAADLFLEVERQHPYSIWATKAQLMSAYSYYEGGMYDDAILAVDRFIQLHPGNADVAYAYYLRGLSFYEQITDVGRDQRNTELALRSLEEVVRRFPDSRYSRDARLKIDLTRDHLAGKEMEVGRYYLTRENYLAAINRFKTVIENFQTTTHVPEALHRLSEAYSALGIESEAQANAAVLGYNFPGSDWYLDSYELVEGDETLDLDGDGKPDLRPDTGGFFSSLWPF
jgi:outer membrane protein assembly factor BamD